MKKTTGARGAYSKGFFLFLSCSLAIHLLLTIGLPDFMGNDSGIIPIRLLASRDLLLDILPEKRVEMPREADQKRGESVSSKAPVDTTVLKRKMEELSLGESLKVPSPDVLLPLLDENVPREERIRRLLASPFYKEIAKAFEESKRPMGNYSGVRFSIDVSPDILKEEKIEIDPGTELVLTRLESGMKKKPGEKQQKGKLGIKGPVARRELTYVPPIPNVKATIETEFEMKFWVRTNGTVDRVIPLKRAGDVELETMATNYLRKWRFRAIPKNEPQIEEWGTVTIEFKLE